MKKFILSTLALVAYAANAQNINSQAINEIFTGSNSYYLDASAAKKAKKTKAEGLYYTKPAGTYYSAARDVDEKTSEVLEYPYSYQAYLETRLVVPALASVKFQNRSNKAASTEWQWNVFNYESLKQYGYITPDNNLSLMLPNRRSTEEMYDSPILYVGDKTFLFGETNYSSYMVISPVMHYLGLNDYQVTHFYASMNDGSYMFGTGKVNVSATESYPCEGMAQFFDKPASPLYIDRFNIASLSKTDFFSANQKLTLTVYNAVVDESGNWAIGDKVLYTAQAGKDNVNYEQSKNGVSYGSIDFCNRNGSLKLIPVTIDQPFCVVITGFNQDGVDVGVRGCDLSKDEASDDVCSTCVLVNDKDNSKLRMLTNNTYKLSMALTFHAIFDNIMVLNESNTDAAYNVVRVSDSGASHFTEGKTAAEGMYTVPVYTACPWKDSNNKANYYWDVNQDNSWVKGVSVDASEYESKGIYGLKFTCAPLPNDITGRTATIWLKGKGITASTPIILLQGNAALTGINGIENNTATLDNGRVYNLAGQQVGSDYKGIVLKNGKKCLKKF